MLCWNNVRTAITSYQNNENKKILWKAKCKFKEVIFKSFAVCSWEINEAFRSLCKETIFSSLRSALWPMPLSALALWASLFAWLSPSALQNTDCSVLLCTCPTDRLFFWTGARCCLLLWRDGTRIWHAEIFTIAARCFFNISWIHLFVTHFQLLSSFAENISNFCFSSTGLHTSLWI